MSMVITIITTIVILGTLGMYIFMLERGALPSPFQHWYNILIDRLRGWGELRRFVEFGEFDVVFCPKCGNRLVLKREINYVDYDSITRRRSVEYKYVLICGSGSHCYERPVETLTFWPTKKKKRNSERAESDFNRQAE